MKLKFLTPLNHLERRAAVFAVLLCLAAFPARAQTEKPPAPGAPEKAEQILRRAVEALGGSNYLNVRTLVGRGLFTQFKDGETGLPATFVDYVVYPDRERTEFKGGGTRFIQTNTGKTGWTYDSAAKSIKDMTPEQVADFQTGMRTSVDYLLRGYWRKDGAALAYVGRREAGLARRNETVRLTYSDGFAVEFEFGAQDGLPAKVVYKKKNAEGEEVPEEDRFAQFVNIQGVVTPFVVDHFRAGAQVSRVNYQSVQYNATVADSLFARPTDIKAVK